MKKVFLLLTMMLCIIVGVNAQSASKETIAVYVTGNLDDSQKQIISAKALSRISRCKEYVTLERTEEFLNAIVKESDYQVSGEVREDQIMSIGQRFGAQLVAILEVNKFDDGTCFLSARIINVESGMVLKSVDATRKITSTDDLIALTNNVTYRLVSKDSK